MKTALRISAITCGLAFLFSVTNASAAVIGHLDIANCAGGGVTVQGLLIDFTLPVNTVGSPGTGCIQTGVNTNVSYSAGTLTPGTTGTILDLVAGGGTVVDFMTFVGHPDLHFDLTSIGPGTGNANCAAATAIGASCSPTTTSPFVFTTTASGTAVSLAAFGIARDTTLPTTPFAGAFTTQITNQTPLQLQTTALAGGAISSTNSGDFALTFTGVPEPSTISMAALGGLLVAFAARKRARL